LVLEIVEGVISGALELPEEATLLWSTGRGHAQAVESRLAGLGSPPWVRAVSYLEDMPLALAATDLALSRAGAMATSEFLAWGIPSVLIPLPTSAEDHQRLNAEALEADGAALSIPEAGLTGSELWARLKPVLTDVERLARMGESARLRGRPHAADEIAASLSRLLPGVRKAAA
jgi:UDP-N-acetylglucosamine--N-acetylmuramyl-(pentapeptide) pyrophosphoryl-undecaprenol N-acetylglucosamine transferase